MLIHYCDACSVRIPSGALESGNAVRAGEKIFCPACAPKTAPARPSAVIPRAAALHPKEATATRLHERPETARRPQGATEPAITPPPSKKYIWVGVVLGGAGLLLALLALNQGAPPEKPAKAASAATATRKSSGSPTAAQPASATPVTRGTPEQTVPQPPLHRPLSEEQQAQQAFEKLFHGLEAQDKDGRITRLKEFVEQYGKTIIVARALNELDRLKRTDPTTPAISSTQPAPATPSATIPLATPPVAPEVVPPIAPPAGVRFKGVWQELKPAAPTPGPRSHHQTMLCYDSKRGRCVLGGGDRKNDLWALDAATASWTCLVPNEPKAPATRPGGLAHDSLVYEEAQDRYFLGAGWTYDPEGGKWNCLFGKPDSPIKTALFNIGRAFAYDPDGKCFLSVSKLNKGREKGLLVYLDPPRLEEVPLAPIPPRDYLYGGLAYDRKHKHFVLFGGYL